MKYLKTFEKHIKLDLDDNDQIYLMTQYIKEYDTSTLSDKKIILYKIKKLFVNGFDPNTNFIDSNLPFVTILNKTSRYYHELLELFVKFGLSGLISHTILLNHVIPWLGTDSYNSIKKLKLLLDSDIDLLVKIESKITRHNNLNIFEIIDNNIEKEKISKKVADKIFDVIRIKKPEQYKQYLIQKEANKYNL